MHCQSLIKSGAIDYSKLKRRIKGNDTQRGGFEDLREYAKAWLNWRKLVTS